MWYFRSPEVVFGPDSLDHLTQLTGRRAFIVSDPTMARLGYVEIVQQKLQAAGIQSEAFTSVKTEPTISVVRRGAAAMVEYQPDWIIGLGGGSPIDAAKAMWILYENPTIDILAVNPFEPLNLRQKARMVAISTTSGTGAEVTWGIVLTNSDERRKFAVGSPENLPDIAIVDPSLTFTMAPQLTADTGMDALTQAIEGYSSTWHNDFSDGLCLKAVQLVFDYLPRAVANPDDMEAREKMHNAGCIAGLGFINSMCSLAHALGHSLGSVFGLPHGRAVGLFLPYTIQFNGNDPDSDPRYHEIAHFLGFSANSVAESANALITAIQRLSDEIGQPRSIQAALNIPLETLTNAMDTLVDHAQNDTQFITAARPADTKDVEGLFLAAYHGSNIDW
jgi:alcohol dehydrogenase class IV